MSDPNTPPLPQQSTESKSYRNSPRPTELSSDSSDDASPNRREQVMLENPLHLAVRGTTMTVSERLQQLEEESALLKHQADKIISVLLDLELDIPPFDPVKEGAGNYIKRLWNLEENLSQKLSALQSIQDYFNFLVKEWNEFVKSDQFKGESNVKLYVQLTNAMALSLNGDLEQQRKLQSLKDRCNACLDWKDSLIPNRIALIRRRYVQMNQFLTYEQEEECWKE